MGRITAIGGVGAAMALTALLAGCSGSSTAADSSAAVTSAAPASAEPSAASASPVAPAASAAPSSDVQAAFQKVLDDAKAKFDFPGAQAGVWTADGEWYGTTGTSAPNGDRPPQRDDHTRIGSITKTFTVATLLQLVDQGKVSLDDPIGKYVSGLPNGDTATLRTLANMTSGIPPYSFNEDFQKAYFSDPSSVFKPQQLVDYIKKTPASFPPGTKVEYSNTNTVLLGMVIEKVTGKPFAEVLKAGILDPLGLTQTSFPGDSNALPSPHLDGITEQTDPDGQVKDATNFNPSWGFTSGAMISTLDDLHAWSVALGTGEGWVSPELQKERVASMTSSAEGNTPDMAYALGFGAAKGWIGHTGELPGYNTSITYDPATGTSIVVMVNSDIPADGKNPAPYISSQLQEALAVTQQ